MFVLIGRHQEESVVLSSSRDKDKIYDLLDKIQKMSQPLNVAADDWHQDIGYRGAKKRDFKLL